MSNLKKYLVLTGLVSPMALTSLTFAQSSDLNALSGNIGGVVSLIQGISQALTLLVFLFFVYSLLKLVFKPDADGAAKTNVIWSVVALFVMTSVWGLVALLGSFFGISDSEGPGNIELPTFNS